MPNWTQKIMNTEPITIIHQFQFVNTRTKTGTTTHKKEDFSDQKII